MNSTRISGVPRGFDHEKVDAACRRSMETGKPVRIAKRHRRPGWLKPMPLYVIWCDDCRHGTVTHPAGKGRIACGLCRNAVRVWTPWRTKNQVAVPLARALPWLVIVFAIVTILLMGNR